MAAPRYFKLGQNLKRLLFERNMKPIDLAREVNLPQPTIHRLVTGKTTRPYRSSLEPIAEFFSVTVEELLGEAPEASQIWDQQAIKKNKDQAITNNTQQLVKNIPIISWNALSSLQAAIEKSDKHIVTIGHLSGESFAVVMADSSMEPFFSQGTLLILDPKQIPKDRSHVLVKLKENNVYVFRQLLIDGDDRYLKPLNPDLSLFKMRILHENDKIIGTLVESRNQYLPDDQQTLLGD